MSLQYCKGMCCICTYGDINCLTGVNENNYDKASTTQVMNRLRHGRFPYNKDMMIKFLVENGMRHDFINLSIHNLPVLTREKIIDVGQTAIIEYETTIRRLTLEKEFFGYYKFTNNNSIKPKENFYSKVEDVMYIVGMCHYISLYGYYLEDKYKDAAREYATIKAYKHLTHVYKMVTKSNLCDDISSDVNYFNEVFKRLPKAYKNISYFYHVGHGEYIKRFYELCLGIDNKRS